MKYFLVFLLFLFNIACQPATVNLASESVRQEQVFCNFFDSNGFEGTLTVNDLNLNNSSYFNTNSGVLSLVNVPSYFLNDVNSYIQVHFIKYNNNIQKPSESPVNLTYFNGRWGFSPIRSSVIDHYTIRQTETRDTREFFNDYKFIIDDVDGWDALNIGIYSNIDEPLAEYQIKLLVPPFTTHPDFFKEEESENPTLVDLHPFSEFLNDEQDESFFLNKAQRACERFRNSSS